MEEKRSLEAIYCLTCMLKLVQEHELSCALPKNTEGICFSLTKKLSKSRFQKCKESHTKEVMF